ncbi:MarR family transcriptional regulator [Actinoplanes sp. NPDC049118]|uniref:LexA family protein n=1 Tax=Actinoplanes sp. NPDC049118 TaxID=3155769 RepID=UPI0033E6B6CA
MAEFRLAEVRDGRARWDTAAPIDPPRLTPRQHAILDFVRAHITTHGYAPTVRQIADGVGLASSSTVSYQLGKLEAKGALRRAADVVRGLHVTGYATTASDGGGLALVSGGTR